MKIQSTEVVGGVWETSDYRKRKAGEGVTVPTFQATVAALHCSFIAATALRSAYCTTLGVVFVTLRYILGICTFEKKEKGLLET